MSRDVEGEFEREVKYWKAEINRRYQISKEILNDPLWDRYSVNFEDVYQRLHVFTFFEGFNQQWSLQAFVAFTGNVEAYEACLEREKNKFHWIGKFDPYKSDKYGRTALHYAAWSGKGDLIKYLVPPDVPLEWNLQKSDKWGLTPLHYAAWSGNWESFCYLATLQGELISEPRDTLIPLSHAAALGGNRKIIQYLIDRGFEMEAADKCGRTAPFLTLWGGSWDALQCFKENHFDLKKRGQDNKTLLHDAAFWGSLEMVRRLIDEEELDPEALDEFGRTPIYYAAWNGRYEILRYLAKEKKLPLHKKDRDGHDVLWHAMQSGDNDCISYCRKKKNDWQYFKKPRGCSKKPSEFELVPLNSRDREKQLHFK